MKNNKGITIVELLAAITIIGILAVVAVPSVYRYVEKSRNQSKETMLKSAYEAAQTYVMDNNILLNSTNNTYTVKMSELVEKEYLEPLFDPSSGDGERCDTQENSEVVITNDETTVSGFANYNYKVTIECPLSGTVKDTFPKTDE